MTDSKDPYVNNVTSDKIFYSVMRMHYHCPQCGVSLYVEPNPDDTPYFGRCFCGYWFEVKWQDKDKNFAVFGPGRKL